MRLRDRLRGPDGVHKNSDTPESGPLCAVFCGGVAGVPGPKSSGRNRLLPLPEGGSVSAQRGTWNGERPLWAGAEPSSGGGTRTRSGFGRSALPRAVACAQVRSVPYGRAQIGTAHMSAPNSAPRGRKKWWPAMNGISSASPRTEAVARRLPAKGRPSHTAPPAPLGAVCRISSCGVATSARRWRSLTAPHRPS